LFLFGFTLEAALGPLPYLACYLAGGLGASALAAWVYAGMGGLGLGASGAISALMGMYAVLYGLRRIRFFYIVLFYFNFARWPALVVLPVWILFELAQHLLGSREVAHMAHLGGLITGAALMAGLKCVRRFDISEDDTDRHDTPQQEAQAARAAELNGWTAKARRLSDELDFAAAAQAWQRAARLAPRDLDVLMAWFDCARHDPSSDSFHAAARQIFRLPPRQAQTRRLLCRCYRTYLETAKPAMRLRPADMQALVRVFVFEQQWQDANSLARALAHIDPPPVGWAQTVQQLASGLAHAGRMEEARVWLPELQRHMPQDEVTHWLTRSAGI
jgi:tetratricopeptide (TPR) repeat protein